jgi:hypothetical protein
LWFGVDKWYILPPDLRRLIDGSFRCTALGDEALGVVVPLEFEGGGEVDDEVVVVVVVVLVVFGLLLLLAGGNGEGRRASIESATQSMIRDE